MNGYINTEHLKSEVQKIYLEFYNLAMLEHWGGLFAIKNKK